MVAANRQHTRVLDNAVGIHHVFRRPAPDINHQCAKLFLFGCEKRKRRCQAVENNFIHFELQAFHRADRILQAVQVSVHNMHVHLNTRAQHSDGIADSILAIDKKVLANRVNDMMLRGQINRLGVLNDVLHVVFRNLAVG